MCCARSQEFGESTHLRHSMYSITSHVLSLEEAEMRFAGIIDLSHPNIELRKGEVLGLELPIPSHTEDLEFGSGTLPALPTLFIWLPEHERWRLQALASREPWMINLHSRNLLRAESFAVLGPEESGIYIPLGPTRAFCPQPDAPIVRIVLIGADRVIDVRHHYMGDDYESFVCGGQAQTTASINYSCTRRYSEEELGLAADLGDEFSIPGYLVRVMRLTTED